MLEFPHDTHTHTEYSDGVGSIPDNVAAAEEKGLRLLGITDHSHYLGPKSLRRYVADIKRWGKESDITVLAGIEGNIIPSGVDVPDWVAEKLDYVIASVHEWLETPEEYLELVKLALVDDNVDVIGHFGASFQYIGFPSVEEVREVLELAEENGKAFEISSRYHVPDVEFVAECIKRGIKLTFASDAHFPAKVGIVGWSEKVFKNAGGRKEDLLFEEFL
ncbi:PHP domain-containing protein [Thermococcus sp. Bubb.Bath]|uniref:PHP domain-containing protein n=1 Tax=Thermococcus sp. Bubb.Bath TaxID=1638242 RepID=UPI00143BE799|nr:PHP domain-containing protein [Thermococcus sp. Bubb.Bath]NJF25390.1 PHP domain-containing protein [Thermococcus sp. Bubb.Bath]